MTPATEAGRILLREHSSGTPHMARHIRAIEAEAVAALRTLLLELADAVLDRPWADPDDDLALLSRKAKRLIEKLQRDAA